MEFAISTATPAPAAAQAPPPTTAFDGAYAGDEITTRQP